MTAAERERAIAGAWANVQQKAHRCDDALKAVKHARAMYDAAIDEWLDLIGERHTDAPPASTPGTPWEVS